LDTCNGGGTGVNILRVHDAWVKDARREVFEEIFANGTHFMASEYLGNLGGTKLKVK
jgi:hypothetical protein